MISAPLYQVSKGITVLKAFNTSNLPPQAWWDVLQHSSECIEVKAIRSDGIAVAQGCLSGFPGCCALAMVHSIYVDPHYQRQGIATSMLEALIQAAQAM